MILFKRLKYDFAPKIFNFAPNFSHKNPFNFAPNLIQFRTKMKFGAKLNIFGAKSYAKLFKIVLKFGAKSKILV